MKNVFFRFNNVSEFGQYLATNNTQEAFVGAEVSMQQGNGWAGSRTFDEAQEKFVNGDKENADKIEAAGIAKERTKIRLNQYRRQIYASPVGFIAHVPNFIAGVPCNMINERRVQVKEKVITLVYNISVGGGVEARDMQEVAVKMLCAIMRAEASGVRINLYVCDLSKTRKQTIGWLTLIKTSGQPLDVLKCAYPLCNPSMLRRHSFRFTEVTKGVSSSFVGGYGGASNDTEELYKTCGLKHAKTLNFYAMRGQTTEQILETILS